MVLAEVETEGKEQDGYFRVRRFVARVSDLHELQEQRLEGMKMERGVGSLDGQIAIVEEDLRDRAEQTEVQDWAARKKEQYDAEFTGLVRQKGRRGQSLSALDEEIEALRGSKEVLALRWYLESRQGGSRKRGQKSPSANAQKRVAALGRAIKDGNYRTPQGHFAVGRAATDIGIGPNTAKRDFMRLPADQRGGLTLRTAAPRK